MTNEEKAVELASQRQGDFLSAFEMAEWKDKQFKEYLEKKQKEQSENLADGPSYQEMVECTIAKAIYQEIINELFEKADIPNTL